MAGNARFTVAAGRHGRRWAPVRLPLAAAPEGPLAVRNVAGGDLLPTQRTADGLVFLLPELAAGATATFEVAPGQGNADAGVAVDEAADALAISIGGAPFTRYTYSGEGLARPYFWPVLGPGGRAITRAYPMQPDAPGETRDHPHHRSVWVAYGELDGVDLWSEGPGHGRTVHQGFEGVTSGPVYGGFTERTRWQDEHGGAVLEETRTVRAYGLPDDSRLLDVDLDWTFERKDARGRRYSLGIVHLGDTKEAGLVAVRVASSMDAKKDGKIENAWGGIGEAETWGKRAPWCDYSGPVEGETLGVAAFDHPNNLHFPCYWHVRDYGLMGANPFSGENFTGNPLENGAMLFRAGDHLRFQYRLYLHRGDASAGRVGEHWANFAFPPRVEVEV